MILVTGTTGNVGAELVPILIDAGEDVRALVRHPSRAVRTPGVELAMGDLDRPASLRRALAGCRAMFLLASSSNLAGLVAEAKAAGVSQLVLLSCQSAEAGDAQHVISAAMARSEAAVRASGLCWTILRPAPFMSNTLAWIPQLVAGDVVHAPCATVAAALIDPYDIAAVAAVAFSSPEHHGRHYRLSGPEPLRPADRVRILAEVLRRPLRFEAQPDDEARLATKTAAVEGMEAWLRLHAEDTLDQSRVSAAVEGLTGRPARRFAQWARAYADQFR
jgi:uncharacterized protein YbjT (DUF2867 family)